MKQKKLFSILFVVMMLFVGMSTEVAAIGPKAIYGTVFIDGAIADIGVEVKIVIDGDTFNTTTVEHNGYNYVIGIPPGYEGKTGYFYVGDDWIPYDNQTVFFSTKIGYIVDLHVNTTVPNQPPNEPINPSPFDGATDVNVDAYLSWSGGDPDGDSVNYDVYFGTTSSPSMVISNQSSTTYHPVLMNYNTRYYWRIVAWDDHVSSAVGPIWDFTTTSAFNNPPGFSMASPSNGAVNISVTTSLLSVYIDDPEDDSFGWAIQTSPDIGSNSGTDESDGVKTCSISGLNYSTTYTWYVNATDPSGSGTYTREIYTFTCVHPPGDMDGNGKLTVGDVRYLAMYINHDPKYTPLHADGNVDSIGGVNVGDVRYLAMYINGDPAYTPLYP